MTDETTHITDGFLKTRTTIHFARSRRGRRELRYGEAPPESQNAIPGRIPRVSRLMALALRLRNLMETGQVHSGAEIARLGHVTRARVTQIMNLLHLAPDIQEDILFLPPTESGRDPIHESHLRPITLVADWGRQRRMWREIIACQGREMPNNSWNVQTQ